MMVCVHLKRKFTKIGNRLNHFVFSLRTKADRQVLFDLLIENYWEQNGNRNRIGSIVV